MKSRIYNIIIIILLLLAVALVASAIAVTTRSTESGTSVVTEPTCTEQGYTTYYTSDGEVEYVGDYVEALGHNYELDSWEWSDDYMAVYGVFECSRCGEQVTEKAVINSEITTDPTQSAAGEITYTATLTFNEEEYQDVKTAVIPSLEDSLEYEKVVTAATCTGQGYTTYTSTDGKYFYVTNYVSALGHEYEYLQTYKATCTSAGYDVYACSRCSDTYTTNYVAATGHDFDDSGVCTVCGASNYIVLTDSDVQKGFSTPFYSAREYYIFSYSVNTVTPAYWTFGLGNDTGDETTYAVAAVWINGEYIVKLCGFDELSHAGSGYTILTSYTTEFTLEQGDYIEIYLVYYGTEENQDVLLTFSRLEDYTGETSDFEESDFSETDDTTVYYEVVNGGILTGGSLPEYTCNVTLSDTSACEYQIVAIYIDLEGDGVEVYSVDVYNEITDESVTVYEIIANYRYSFIMPAGDVTVTIYLEETE